MHNTNHKYKKFIDNSSMPNFSTRATNATQVLKYGFCSYYHTIPYDSGEGLRDFRINPIRTYVPTSRGYF